MAASGAAPAYRRVLLKISGEALAGGQSYGIDPEVITRIADEITEGKLSKFYEDQCLVDQAYIRDSSGKLRVGDLVAQLSAQTGEKIAIRRFVRFQVGE